jgi:hypothetical protein
VPRVDLLAAPRDVNPSAAIVKTFLRELPQPLIPREMTQLFVDALSTGEDGGEAAGDRDQVDSRSQSDDGKRPVDSH